MTGEWNYSGDVSMVYGGFFVKCDYQEFRWGYLNYVEVTDLDSACGARGMCLIERGNVNGTTDKERIRKGMACVGMTARDLLRMPNNSARMAAIAYALRSYGYMDVDDSEVVQTEEGAPMKFDGWTAGKFIGPNDLRGYVEAKYINE
jgi:hypothetical protein